MPRLASAAQLVEARRAGGFEAAKSIVDTGLPNEEMARLRQALQSLEVEEEQLLRGRLADHDRRLQWFWAGMAALVAGLFAALAVLYLQVRRRRGAQEALLVEMRERARLDEELQRLNRSLEALVRERTAELRGANADLLDAKLRLRDLSSQLITAQEQERRHIARELHDDTGQSLSVMRMHLSDLLRGGAGAMARLPDCIALVDAAIAQIRAMALSLRPTMLDDLGLADALQWALEHQAKAAGWRTDLEADDIPVELPADIQTACFRIAQEALANAARHAGASEVKLGLRMVGNELELTVRDNGAGFDLERYRSPAGAQEALRPHDDDGTRRPGRRQPGHRHRARQRHTHPGEISRSWSSPCWASEPRRARRLSPVKAAGSGASALEAGGDCQQRRSDQPRARDQQKRAHQLQHRRARPAGRVPLDPPSDAGRQRQCHGGKQQAWPLNCPVGNTTASRNSELVASAAISVSRSVSRPIGWR